MFFKMKDIFNIDKKYKSFKDENLDFVDSLTMLEANKPLSGFIFMKMEDFEKDIPGSIKKLQNIENQSWGILSEEVSKIYQEFARLIRSFKEYYTSKSDFTEKNLSPHEVHYIVHKSIVRIKRIACVLNPEFSIITFTDKKTNNSYEMIKGYWINDEGRKVRSLSRNVGKVEASMIELTTKLFKLNKEHIITHEPSFNLHFRPDLIIFDGKTEWIVETKMLDKGNFVKTYVMFELWKMYKEEYKDELLI